jgi:hypothetical protein
MEWREDFLNSPPQKKVRWFFPEKKVFLLVFFKNTKNETNNAAS